MRKSICKAAALDSCRNNVRGPNSLRWKDSGNKGPGDGGSGYKGGADRRNRKGTGFGSGERECRAKRRRYHWFLQQTGVRGLKYHYFYPKFQEFQEVNADTMDITLETYSTEDYKTKIKTQTASGDLPDVFTYWGGAMMTDMVEAGLLLDVGRVL